jgi:Stage II sporulation protein E (SpoIIE)
MAYPAALIASMVKLAAASQRAVGADPSRFLSGMNLALLGNTQNQFVTAAYVHLNSESGELRYSAAAHPPLLLLRSGRVTQVEKNGLMLAAFAFASYSTAVHKLEAGDRMVMYTDGIFGGFQCCGGFLRARGLVRSAEKDSRPIPRDGGGLYCFFSSTMVGKTGRRPDRSYLRLHSRNRRVWYRAPLSLLAGRHARSVCAVRQNYGPGLAERTTTV